MSRRIEDLSNKEKNNLVNDYFENKEISVAEIIKKYDLDYKKSELVRFLPYRKTTEMCPYCNETMSVKIRGRGILDYPKCSICGHIKYDNSYLRCECVNCRQLIIEEQNKKRRLIEKVYIKHNKVNFCDLDLQTQISLARVILKASNDFILFDPSKIDGSDWTFFDKYIEKEYFTVSSENDIKVFEEGDDFPYYYNKYRVLYDINIDFSEEEKELLRVNKYFCKKSHKSEKLEMLYSLIHEDVLNIYRQNLYKRGIVLTRMTSAENKFKELYKVLSYGQIINQCYGIARWISDCVVTGKMDRTMASERAIYLAYYNINKGLDKHWIIKNSNVSFAGKELQNYITDILGKDIQILESVVTEDML